MGKFLFLWLFVFGSLCVFSLPASAGTTLNIQGHQVSVAEVQFFEAGSKPPDRKDRQYSQVFSQQTARYIYYQVHLEHPNLSQNLNFSITAQYFNPDDSLFGEFNLNTGILSSWNGSFHWHGYGWSTPGNWKTGTYKVKLFYGNQEIYQGSFSIINGSPIPPPDQWLDGFPVSLNESNLDDFCPAPEYSSRPFLFKRAIDPFGTDLDWFQSTVVSAQQGGVRITDIYLNNIEYWLDMQVNAQDPSLPLQIIDVQVGKPQKPYPAWGFGHDVLDFRMSEAEVFGPPAYFSIFDVGLKDRTYHLDFSSNGQDFALSNVIPSGYMHYFPNSKNPKFGLITKSPQPPEQLMDNGLCFPDTEVPHGSPLALFNVNKPDGEAYLNVDYCWFSAVQKFEINQGVALGTYAPHTDQSYLFSTSGDTTDASFFGGLFSSPTREEELDQCIKDQTTQHIGLHRDNQLSQKLFDLAFAFGNDLKLSNKTLEATKTALIDSKDVVGDYMFSDNVSSENVSKFVLTTLLKNATPAEHEEFVKKFFDQKVPENFQTLVQGAGTTQEKQYKLALLGITKNAVKTYFPKSSALAESIIEGQQWAMEVMADDDVRVLYEKYKYNNGNWKDTWDSDALYRPNLHRKVKQLLEKRGSSKSPESYLENLFSSWYAQEKDAPQKEKELEEIKEEYLDNSFVQNTFDRVIPDANECERLKMMADYVHKARMDLVQSMGACKYKPTKDSIRQTAITMASRLLRDIGSITQRKQAYNEAKLAFLKSWECDNYEEPARSEVCNHVVEHGANEPEVLRVNLGKTSGTFQFGYQTYTVKDRITVAYENKIIFDSGCVGTKGKKTVPLSYSGQSDSITVRAEPNCDGSSSTKWYFEVSCP